MTGEELELQIATVAEMIGHEIRPNAAKAMVLELADYQPEDIMVALRRCSRELSGRLTLAAILERMPGQHPSPNEAWALCPQSEADTVVWTEQIAEAYGQAAPLLADGDTIAARMAFLETYKRLVGEACGAGPKWRVSLGHDVSQRERVVRDAVARGRLSSGYAEKLLPPPQEPPARALSAGEPPPDFAALRALVAGYAKGGAE